MEKMNVLLMGSGGRESALAYKILQSAEIKFAPPLLHNCVVKGAQILFPRPVYEIIT